MFWELFDRVTLQKLCIAAVAGVVLGYPYRHRPGGIRAHFLVTLGGAYFCVTAIHVVGPSSRELMRILQGVTSGIGFVGAASVLKQGGAIHGVSTAASIWIAAAVGCDAGLGDSRRALVTATAITAVSVLLGWIP